MNIFKKNNLNIKIFVILFLFVCECRSFAFKSKVIRVIDGDTIVIQSGEKIRYIGMDTPEMKDPRPQVRYFAQKAKEVNANLVLNKIIDIEFDVEKYDKYKRLLAYIYVGKTMVNAYLLKEGYASVLTIPPNVKYQEYFLKLQKYARENNKGFWKELNYGIEKIKKNKQKNNNFKNTFFSQKITTLLRTLLKELWW